MASVEVSGKTVDEAIAKALEQLGVGEDDVTVEVLEEGRGGVLGVGAEKARVVVTLVTENIAEPAPAAEGEDGDEDLEDDEAEAAAQILDKLLELMGIEADVSIRDAETPGDGEGLVNAVLDVEGDDLGILIGRRGETLASLQFLLNLIASRSLGQRISFTVDVEGYRRRRERQLQQMARRLADQVKRAKKPMTMEPMPPNERRIVHLTLSEDRSVSTSSIGEGDARQVGISPAPVVVAPATTTTTMTLDAGHNRNAAPQFVVAGHAARDIVPEGWRLGGTVTFAAYQAHRLGYSVGVLTKAASDIDVAAQLPFADVRQVASATTTTFENLYEHGARTQSVHARGEPIDASDVPPEWRDAPIVLIGPVLGEVAHDFASAFAGASLVAVSVQGWLRDVDAERRVVRTRWDGPPFWHGADVLFLSDEDIAGAPDQLDAWLRDVSIVAMTESWRGARVYADGAWRRMDAFPEDEVDPTGAGDTFATALLIRLHETGDVAQAARFGAAAASLSVGGIAAATIPTREEIEARLAQHPEVALR